MFAGYGIINGTIDYSDNGTGVYLTNPDGIKLTMNILVAVMILKQ